MNTHDAATPSAESSTSFGDGFELEAEDDEPF
jgi:hypothetical protein